MHNCWMSCLLMFRCTWVWFISKERVEGKTGWSNVWLEHLSPCKSTSFLAVYLGNHCPTKAMCACFELANWCTNHGDVISSALLTVQRLRAERAPVSPPNRTSKWELQKMPFPASGVLSKSWGAASSKAEQRMKCQTLVFHAWHHLWQLHQNNNMERRCQYLLRHGPFTNLKNLDMSDSQVLRSQKKSFPAKWEKKPSTNFSIYSLKFSWDFCLCFVDTFLSVAVFLSASPCCASSFAPLPTTKCYILGFPER